MSGPETFPPGWYRHPSDPSRTLWWDGSQYLAEPPARTVVPAVTTRVATPATRAVQPRRPVRTRSRHRARNIIAATIVGSFLLVAIISIMVSVF